MLISNFVYTSFDRTLQLHNNVVINQYKASVTCLFTGQYDTREYGTIAGVLFTGQYDTREYGTIAGVILIRPVSFFR